MGDIKGNKYIIVCILYASICCYTRSFYAIYFRFIRLALVPFWMRHLRRQLCAWANIQMNGKSNGSRISVSAFEIDAFCLHRKHSELF